MIKKGKVIKLSEHLSARVDYDDGRTPEIIATELAKALKDQVLFQADIGTFRFQVAHHHRTIMELEELKREVIEFRKNPPKRVSRMDKRVTCDLEKVDEQIAESKALIKKYEEISAESTRKARDAEVEIVKLQRELEENKKSVG